MSIPMQPPGPRIIKIDTAGATMSILIVGHFTIKLCFIINIIILITFQVSSSYKIKKNKQFLLELGNQKAIFKSQLSNRALQNFLFAVSKKYLVACSTGSSIYQKEHVNCLQLFPCIHNTHVQVYPEVSGPASSGTIRSGIFTQISLASNQGSNKGSLDET
jgi:hypothetical protein